MRDRMERLVVLPFTAGCVSYASVAVSEQQPRRSKPDTNSSTIRAQEEDQESFSDSMKNSFRLLALPKPNISTGFHRLVKGFKNFSQLFVPKEDMEDSDEEMQIGFPTDVKHVTHIGWDGSATTNPIKGWDNLIPPELLSLPAVSLRQF
ncbi:CRIB domain-containing protein RIC4 [Vitis riparia]|uniref:CRIB domain-containing protein RIC4 n=1 Tax=Vitis riparia TaxID=96939 RepID=UPI00155AAE11|nr:CRIB domain-containing protein RIC4 [Vitis riparia]